MEKVRENVSREKIKFVLAPNDYINKAFKSIPVNCNIHKGRCGIGGTTLEIRDKRHSIIVAPNISIIKSKKKEFDFIFEVYGDVSEAQIKKYLENNIENRIKIMSTPDSFYKIINASESIGWDVYNNAFLLSDESHSVITEAGYRDMTEFYKLFFKFNEKTLISATSISFSDKRFASLKNIEISIFPPIKKAINVICSTTIEQTLLQLVKLYDQTEENLHIFYNTVEGVKQMIDIIGAEGVSVFCADNKLNRLKLEKYSTLLMDVNSESYKVNKVNFYTTKYYEGWDLFDTNAVIVLLTNTYNENTCLDVSTKGTQIIGRLRNVNSKKIYHITNTKGCEGMERRKVEEVKQSRLANAIETIKTCNNIIDYLEGANVREDVKREFHKSMTTTAQQYGNINYLTGKAEINFFKVDNLVYNDLAVEQYLNKETILKSWTSSGFDVKLKIDNAKLSLRERKILSSQRTSKAEKNKIIYEKFNSLIQDNKEKKIIFNSEDVDELISLYPKEYKIFTVLGFEKIQQLNFSKKEIEQEFTIKNSNKVEVTKDLISLIYSKFKPYHFYSSEIIKKHLGDFNKKLGIIRISKASSITNYYEAGEKIVKIDGKPVRGYLLRNKLFK